MERQEATKLSLISPGHRARYEFAVNRVKGRVLDAACGVGYGSRMLHDAGCSVVGVDLSPKALGVAEAHYKGPGYILGDVVHSPWIGKFDWIVSFETIEHIPDPLMALKRFRESGNNLIVSTPNQNDYPFDPAKFVGDEFPHLRHYTPPELDALLSESGWEVTQRCRQKGKQDPVTEGNEGKFIIYVCR